MQKRPLGRSGLEIAPLVFGGNVFGWTADEQTSFELLDGFVDAGFNAIDTADSYSRWAPGHSGGESEAVIGRWLKANPAKRDKVLIMTKVGSDMGQGHNDLSAGWIVEEVEASLRRLQVERIDLYQSHWPDPKTPYEETLGAYARLLEQGKVRAIGCSNLDAQQLGEALAVARDKGLPRYETLQPCYNLYDRAEFEGLLCDLVQREEIGVITYFSLGAGFLTGKYRSKDDLAGRARGQRVEKYLNERGFRIISALEAVAGRHGAKPAEVALAWVMARPGITAPIASATSRGQLDSLVKSASLTLSAEDMAELTKAGD
ncbi:Predicted oxidoreductase [Tistlia consotensis]|uniref:Predicted oxidoreductase n=1 Tax=Tistlia consotensis USBA 355 TaxID=560819 RepID=A0A1Y6CIB0_9PROT|nr:aldo/keto reductase [Tistlia consotensis]SMF55795.1 Predicted oxidoreductase [Tistlia consotensis USBA 355]SNR89339.1 Predicted oxidoreductase [Tistlia consotensis]